MKSLILLEGIASSGKTTLSSLLKATLEPNHTVRVFTEDETLMDIVNDWSVETAKRRLNDLLYEFRKSDAEVLISDRYHFTHLTRIEKSFDEIRDIEDALCREFNAHVFLLTLEEKQIAPRVQDSWDRRGTWLGKEGSIEEKAVYYTSQQQRIRLLARESRIPVTELNTTSKDWLAFCRTIVAAMQLG